MHAHTGHGVRRVGLIFVSDSCCLCRPSCFSNLLTFAAAQQTEPRQELEFRLFIRLFFSPCFLCNKLRASLLTLIIFCFCFSVRINALSCIIISIVSSHIFFLLSSARLFSFHLSHPCLTLCVLWRLISPFSISYIFYCSDSLSITIFLLSSVLFFLNHLMCFSLCQISKPDFLIFLFFLTLLSSFTH